MNYIFGGNTPMTDDAVQERRRIARQLLARASQRPQHWSDGIASSVAAIASSMHNRQADKGEAILQGEFDAQIQTPERATMGGGSTPTNSASSSAEVGASTANEIAKGMMFQTQPVNRNVPQMAPSPGVVPEQNVYGGVAMPNGIARMEMRGMMPGVRQPRGPNVQPNPTPGTATGGYRNTSRQPAPPVDDRLMDAEMRAMMFERENSDKDTRTRRQDEAFTPERLDEEGPPPSPQQLQEMAQSVGIDPTALQGLDLNTSEARNFGYLLRMMEAENTIRDLSDANTWGNRLLEYMIPGQGLESFLMDPDYRRFMVARENFNEAALRSATGATINQSEMPTQRQNYFPLPNDDDETRALIERQRQALMMALAAGSGPAAAIIPQFGEPVVPRQTQATATMRFNPNTGQLEPIQ